jgi:transcriptional regulator with XRE-family HTH domain
MTVGSRLRRAREKMNLSQLEVSRRTNINNKTLSRYENDGAEPDHATLKVLADLYGVSISYLFDGDSAQIYDLEELLKGRMLTWDGELLNEEERNRAIDILNILLQKKKDTN